MSTNYRLKAAEAVAQIVILDLPTNAWQGVISLLSNGVTESNTSMEYKEACLTALSEICVGSKPDDLTAFSFDVLFAIITGMDSPHPNLQLVATKALSNAIQFSESNFNDNEQRASIMSLVGKMMANERDDVRLAAYSCAVNIAIAFYSHLSSHMNQGLYTATLQAIQSDPSEQVVMQAIEFWSSICEEESNIYIDNEAAAESGAEIIECHNFIQGAVGDLAPLLFASLQRGDVDPEMEESTVASAAAACISLISTTIGDDVIPHFINNVSANINDAEEVNRVAAILCFGCIMDGPSTESLQGVIFDALPILFARASDESSLVKHTTAWCLGSIAQFHPAAISTHLQGFLSSVCSFFGEVPAIAATAVKAISNLTNHIATEKRDESPLNEHLEALYSALCELAERTDGDDAGLRIEAYTAIRGLVNATPDNQIQHANTVLDMFETRLQATIGTAVEAEYQGEVVSILASCSSRLKEMLTEATTDRLMTLYIELLNSRVGVTAIYSDVFLAISSISDAIGPAFDRYMQPISGFLLHGLEQISDDSLCLNALLLSSSICYAMQEGFAPYASSLVPLLVNHLAQPDVPAALCNTIIMHLGDIAHILGSDFINFLPTVMQALQKYEAIAAKSTEYLSVWDEIEAITGFRNALLATFVLFIGALGQHHPASLRTFMPSFHKILNAIAHDRRRDDDVNRAACGLIADLAVTFPDLRTSLRSFDGLLQYCLSSNLSSEMTKDAADDAIFKVNH